jgi:DNA repair protein RadC
MQVAGSESTPIAAAGATLEGVSAAPLLSVWPTLPAFDRRSSAADAVLEVESRGASAGQVPNVVCFAWIMAPLVARERQEVAWVMSLGSQGEFRRVTEIGRGTYDRVDVALPIALRAAIDAQARYLILAHNHPSGLAWPSDEDRELTIALDSAAAETGLVLLDHVVLGDGQAYSFREGQLWQTR